MKKPFSLTVLTVLLFCTFNIIHSRVCAQDPGTVIDVVITKDGKPVTDAKECLTWTVLFRRSDWSINDTVKSSVKPVSYEFQERYIPGLYIFYWDGYHGEVLELTLVHQKDTMIIRVKDSIKFMFNAFFHFEIPFKKGYYELPEPVYRTDIKGFTGLTAGYIVDPSYSWEAIPARKRKLLINGN